MAELTPKQTFLMVMRSRVDIPGHLDDQEPAALLTEVAKIVIPLEGQKLMSTAMLMLNGPLRTDLPEELIKPLNDKLVGVIYEMMRHPLKNLAGQDFRTAGGADRLGAAGMPYARSVIPRTNPKEYPDAEEVFNKLMLRQRIGGKERIVNHPEGLSSLTFAYGTLVIHSVFRSALQDPTMNETSSSFDLSPLYGDNIDEQMAVRNRIGRGLLAPDCFADTRNLILPPAAAALLIVFNRNHNYIAAELLKNEKDARGWSDPPPEDSLRRNKQDEEIFQIARLINCVHFVNIVITDYVGGIIGRTRGGGGWPMNAMALDPIVLPDRAITFANDQTQPIRATHVGRALGNLVSIEFNTLYRWHATLSEMDVKWIEDIIEAALGRNDFENLTPEDYIRAFKISAPNKNEAPTERTFGGLVRGQDGHFNDADLARIIFDATEAPAGMFRAHGTPQIMAFIDIRGIRRAREMNTCTLNEFREWLGLPKYKSFVEWNKDPKVAQAASDLYGGDIERLELYAGLHAEGASGDGLQNYDSEPLRVSTMRNGLLFDAIALIRGDRFLTTAFNEENYTKTGIADVQRDTTNKAFGGCIHKLLFRTLKGFPQNSVYSWFPMTTPETMRGVLGDDGKWSFNRPSLPKTLRAPKRS
ncbi:heme peroxidase [Pholiota molesta]|nr:heme peroxidase [Pholiota molesta]